MLQYITISLLFEAAQLAGVNLDIIIGAEITDHLQGRVTFPGYLKTLPAGDFSVHCSLKYLLV